MNDDYAPKAAGQLHNVTPPPTPHKRRRMGRWLFAMVCIGGVIGAGVVGLMKLVNDPVVSADATTLNEVKATPTTTPHLNKLSGLSIELDYPSFFDEIGRINTVSGAIEQYNISSKAEYRRAIAIAVFTLPSGNLQDDSSYKYRLINPSLYTMTKATVGGETVTLATKADHTERTLFWVHSGKDLNLAITSTAAGDDVNAFMAAVMPTIRWRQ